MKERGTGRRAGAVSATRAKVQRSAPRGLLSGPWTRAVQCGGCPPLRQLLHSPPLPSTQRCSSSSAPRDGFYLRRPVHLCPRLLVLPARATSLAQLPLRVHRRAVPPPPPLLVSRLRVHRREQHRHSAEPIVHHTAQPLPRVQPHVLRAVRLLQLHSSARTASSLSAGADLIPVPLLSLPSSSCQPFCWSAVRLCGLARLSYPGARSVSVSHPHRHSGPVLLSLHPPVGVLAAVFSAGLCATTALYLSSGRRARH